jgi:hypothetical protein
MASLFLCFVADKEVLVVVGRLITALSMTSVTDFMSGLFADVMIAESGILFLSVKSPFCAYLASISMIVSSHIYPKGDFMDMLSSDCQVNLIPILWSYMFNNQSTSF